MFPIVAKQAHPVLIWLYTIHTKRNDEGLIIHYNVSQEDIVKEMDLQFNYKVGDTVELGPFARRKIGSRKWDFQKGEPLYFIEGARAGRGWAMCQSELIRRIQEREQPV